MNLYFAEGKRLLTWGPYENTHYRVNFEIGNVYKETPIDLA
jgi:hypothetical protein